MPTPGGPPGGFAGGGHPPGMGAPPSMGAAAGPPPPPDMIQKVMSAGYAQSPDEAAKFLQMLQQQGSPGALAGGLSRYGAR